MVLHDVLTRFLAPVPASKPTASKPAASKSVPSKSTAQNGNAVNSKGKAVAGGGSKPKGKFLLNIWRIGYSHINRGHTKCNRRFSSGRWCFFPGAAVIIPCYRPFLYSSCCTTSWWQSHLQYPAISASKSKCSHAVSLSQVNATQEEVTASRWQC